MTIDTDRLPALIDLRLDDGGHDDWESGACLLEAVSYVAGEEFSDHPTCACKILGAFGRSLNDCLPDEKRQQLVPLVPQIVGTADDGHQQARGLMAADWLIRTYTPTWLRLAGLQDSAVSLETRQRQVSWDDVEAAVPLVRAARQAAREKRDAAGAAAWDAARDAAGDAAGAAARAAARDAAGDAAGAAARDAARDAAGDAAGAAARAAARDAAWDAAGAAARDAAWAAAWDAAWDAAGNAARNAAGPAAWDAAGNAARDALQPTVDQLHDSAIELYTRMVALGQEGRS